MNLLRPNEAAKEDEMNPKSDFVISRASVPSMAGMEMVIAFLRQAREKYARESNQNMAQGKAGGRVRGEFRLGLSGRPENRRCDFLLPI